MNESDFFEDTFSGLDDFYPGSKRKRKPPVEKPEPSLLGWDERPYVKPLPSGKDIELFTIGALAKALNRPLITIRQWISLGHIPQSPYRLPAKPDKNGNTRLGRRLYSRAMIQAAIDIFDSKGLLDGNRIEWTKNRQVTQDLQTLWNKLREEEAN